MIASRAIAGLPLPLCRGGVVVTRSENGQVVLRVLGKSYPANGRHPGSQGKKARALRPSGGNNLIMTPDDVALDATVHSHVAGFGCEPCSGKGAFLRAFDALGIRSDSYEILRDRDFLAVNGDEFWDFILTNPPYGSLTGFLVASLRRATNVVFLVLEGALGTRARKRAIESARFGTVEVCEVPLPTKSEGWGQFGLPLALVWLRRDWSGCQRDAILYPEQRFEDGDRTFRFVGNRRPGVRAKLCKTGQGAYLRLLDSSIKFVTRAFPLGDYVFDSAAVVEASVLAPAGRGAPQRHLLLLGLAEYTMVLTTTGKMPRRISRPHGQELDRWLEKGYRLIARLDPPQGGAL